MNANGDHPVGSEQRPAIQVTDGWVSTNETSQVPQIGFSVVGWTPGKERVAQGAEARDMIKGMGFPEAIALWLRGLFAQGYIVSVMVTQPGSHWQVSLNVISSPRNNAARAAEIVRALCTAANLPWGSPGQQGDEMSAIAHGTNLTEEELLSEWLARRIQSAVQHIFATSQQ